MSERVWQKGTGEGKVVPESISLTNGWIKGGEL